jgi:hypothetical protein
MRHTNPISGVFRPKTRVAGENKANVGGRGPRLGIGDLGLGIRGRRIETAQWDVAPNKPNLPSLGYIGAAGAAAIGDCGFGIGDSRCEIRVSRVDRITNKANLPLLATSQAAMAGPGGLCLTSCRGLVEFGRCAIDIHGS